jgi:nucleoside 2-deoxyribosyltransferase
MQAIDKNSQRRRRAYLAGPLFNDAERSFNELLARTLEKWADVYLPQRDGGLMSDMVRDGVSPETAASRVFWRDMDAIRQSDLLVAILDGRAIDEGVAFELGIAFAQSKACVGLQTDSRPLASWGNNPMITGALEMIFTSVDDLVGWFHHEVGETALLGGHVVRVMGSSETSGTRVASPGDAPDELALRASDRTP